MDSIFIFTKDRPDVLKRTLISISSLNIRIFIIDDSFQKTNQLSTKILTSYFSDVFYNGQDEFSKFLSQHNIDANNCKSILRQIGNNEWNLGYARNLALFFSKALHIENVLFIDDDIIVNNDSLILNSFKLLEQFDFVGASISGMADDSIIGHVSTELGIIDSYERMLSGGFLAFKPKKIKIPFINVYNEDWIWLFLHSNESKYLQMEGVFQNYSNPYLRFKEKIIFQEIGEIIILGILEVKENNEFIILTTEVFWTNILNERKKYLNKVYKSALMQHKIELAQMIKWIVDKYPEINSSIFMRLFRNYNENKEMFTKLYNSI